MHILRECTFVLLGQQIFLLTAHKVRAIHGEEGLALAHVLVGRICKHILNPARKAGLHIGELLFVDVHISRNAQVVAYVLEFRNRCSHADFLKPLRRQLNRGKRGFDFPPAMHCPAAQPARPSAARALQPDLARLRTTLSGRG